MCRKRGADRTSGTRGATGWSRESAGRCSRSALLSTHVPVLLFVTLEYVIGGGGWVLRPRRDCSLGVRAWLEESSTP